MPVQCNRVVRLMTAILTTNEGTYHTDHNAVTTSRWNVYQCDLFSNRFIGGTIPFPGAHLTRLPEIFMVGIFIFENFEIFR